MLKIQVRASLVGRALLAFRALLTNSAFEVPTNRSGLLVYARAKHFGKSPGIYTLFTASPSSVVLRRPYVAIRRVGLFIMLKNPASVWWGFFVLAVQHNIHQLIALYVLLGRTVVKSVPLPTSAVVHHSRSRTSLPRFRLGK